MYYCHQSNFDCPFHKSGSHSLIITWNLRILWYFDVRSYFPPDNDKITHVSHPCLVDSTQFMIFCMLQKLTIWFTNILNGRFQYTTISILKTAIDITSIFVGITVVFMVGLWVMNSILEFFKGFYFICSFICATSAFFATVIHVSVRIIPCYERISFIKIEWDFHT